MCVARHHIGLNAIRPCIQNILFDFAFDRILRFSISYFLKGGIKLYRVGPLCYFRIYNVSDFRCILCLIKLLENHDLRINQCLPWYFWYFHMNSNTYFLFPGIKITSYTVPRTVTEHPQENSFISLLQSVQNPSCSKHMQELGAERQNDRRLFWQAIFNLYLGVVCLGWYILGSTIMCGQQWQTCRLVS